jgi:hypothetical protein
MEESLSFVVTFEGGQPFIQLVVLEGYLSQNRIMEIPFGLLDFQALVRSAQATGDYWIVNTTADLPDFQVDSSIFVRHREGKILWDLIYEHYDPFLDVELEEDEDNPPEEGDENIITLHFDPFQYVSAIYQFCQLYPQFKPVTFQPTTQESNRLEHYLPQLHILWRRFGQIHGSVNEDGILTRENDLFAEQAEEQWTDEILQALFEMRDKHSTENIDAYLESLPEEILAKFEADSSSLEQALNERWEKLVNSLTEEEAEALKTNQSQSKFPNSLKLKLLREVLAGNPTILLGHSPSVEPDADPKKVVSIEHWRREKS